MNSSRLLGKNGEDFAAAYLKENGYAILRRNFRCRIGEADIIARKGDILTFIEVKTRGGEVFGFPEAAVNARKQEKLRKVAACFIEQNGICDLPVQFDVIAIELEHIENCI